MQPPPFRLDYVGSTLSSVEFAPDGLGLREKTRTYKIFNTPEQLYAAIRSHDSGLLATEERVRSKIEGLTGYRAEDVGSFGLLLNLPGSDLDLAIGVLPDDQKRVLELLHREGMRFKGERPTSATTTRKVFELDFENLQVDIGVLPRDDFDLLVSSLKRCVAEMTDQERVEHVWRKWNLKQEGRREEYAQLKLEPYARFCPSFIWTPIL
jgi:hypothetical protein